MKPYPAIIYLISPCELDSVVCSAVFVVDSGPSVVVTDSVSSVVEPSAENVNTREIKYVTIVETRHGHRWTPSLK